MTVHSVAGADTDAIQWRIVTDTAGLRELGPDWSRIAETAAATPFQSFAWNLAWWEIIGEPDADVDLHVLVVTDAARSRLIAPFMRRRDANGSRVLTFLSEPWYDYGDILLDPVTHDPERLLDILVEHVVSGLGGAWDAVAFPEVRSESVFAGHLLTRAGGVFVATPGSSCPVRALGPLDVGRSKSHRRRLMMAARIGTPRFGLYTQPGEIVDRMPRYMAMHVRQWFPRPDCGFTFTDPELLRFYLGCVPYLAPAGVLGLAELMYGSQPAAYYYGFLHRGAFWGYRPAYEAGFAETSPGAILQKELQSVLYRSGYDTFDMLRGDFAYKQRYATRVNQNLDIRLAC